MIRIGNIGFEYEGCRRLRELTPLGSIEEVGTCGYTVRNGNDVYLDGLALFRHLKDKLGLEEGATILIWGCGAGDILTAAVAASMLGAYLTISERCPEAPDVYRLVIAPKFSGGDLYISSDELCAVILGERVSVSRPSAEFSHDTATFGFISADHGTEQREYYTELSLLTVGAEYISASSLLPSDKQLSILPPFSRDGFIFGLLAPYMIGANSCYSPPSPTLPERVRDYSPTRLLCHPSVARGLADECSRLDKTPIRREGSSATEIYKRFQRLIRDNILSPRRTLKAVTVIGDLPSEVSGSLLELGIYHTSLLSFRGCPLAGYRYGKDESGVWRLPSSLSADMCNVSAGGVGALTFCGSTVADGVPDGFTFSPWKYRREYGGKVSVISDLYGFMLKKRRFFVKGRLNF